MTLSVRGCLLPTSDSVGKIGIVNACGHDVGAVVVVRLPIDIFLVPSEGQCGMPLYPNGTSYCRSCLEMRNLLTYRRRVDECAVFGFHKFPHLKLSHNYLSRYDRH